MAFYRTTITIVFLLQSSSYGWVPVGRNHQLSHHHTLVSVLQAAPSNCHVLDDVFSTSVAAKLRDELVASDNFESSAAEETRVVDRWDPDSAQGPVERALLGFLDEWESREGIASSSTDQPAERYVEWWWRDEWLDFEAHRDVSEREAARSAETDRRLRCPSWAHVLYLSVDEQVRGPTCIWELDEEGAIRLNEEGNNDAVLVPSTQTSSAHVSVVPAVAGRVLRFRGDLLHSVPRPGLRYMLTDDFVEGDEEEEEEDDENTRYEDDEDDVDGDDENDADFESIERAVILFNTWAEPPLDKKSNSVMAGLDFEVLEEEGGEAESSDNAQSTVDATLASPAENSDSGIDLSCQPHHLWKASSSMKELPWEDAADSSGGSLEASRVILGVPLLGDRFRRGRKANALVVLAPKAAAEKAMLSAKEPYQLPLLELKSD